MKTVGVRELKNRLSEYLRRLRAGESVLVTDRGEVVAEFSPPRHGQADESVPAGLRALARRGIATVGAASDAALYKALAQTARQAHGCRTSQRGTRLPVNLYAESSAILLESYGNHWQRPSSSSPPI